MQPEIQQIKQLIEQASNIVIIQADNPDGDSLGSSLGLEQILGNLGKQVHLYCGVDMPSYLRYMPGWDRVSSDLPNNFDLSIVVDASTMTLLDKLQNSGQIGWLGSKPSIVLDHHEIVDNPISFAGTTINDAKRSSTGELIYALAKELEWPLDVTAQEFLMTSILGDTQGLTNQLASSETYRIMAEMVDAGVDRPALEEKRREYGKMPLEIFKYKADLIKRTEFDDSHRVAIVIVSDPEIKTYSPLYNPAPLIQNDMLQTSGVEVAVVIKSYKGGRVTAAIRSNINAPVAGKLAEHFGGGGHKHASGFKIDSGAVANDVKDECVKTALEMLDNQENVNETA